MAFDPMFLLYVRRSIDREFRKANNGLPDHRVEGAIDTQAPDHTRKEWIEFHWLDFDPLPAPSTTLTGWVMFQFTCASRPAEQREDVRMDRAYEIALKASALFGRTNISVRAHGSEDDAAEVGVLNTREPSVTRIASGRDARDPYGGVEAYAVTIRGYVAVP